MLYEGARRALRRRRGCATDTPRGVSGAPAARSGIRNLSEKSSGEEGAKHAACSAAFDYLQQKPGGSTWKGRLESGATSPWKEEGQLPGKGENRQRNSTGSTSPLPFSGEGPALPLLGLNNMSA